LSTDRVTKLNSLLIRSVCQLRHQVNVAKLLIDEGVYAFASQAL